MKKKLFIIFAVVLVLALSAFVLMGFTSSDGTNIKTMHKAMTGKSAALLNAAALDSGKAFISREGGKLYHYAVAALPSPAEGMFYEGWLLNGSGDKMSTGKLTMDAGGNYEVAFMADMAMEGYNTVVITTETKMDGIPETKVLSGVVDYVAGLMVPIDGQYYYFTGAPVGDSGATDIPGHSWIITGDNSFIGAHFNSGPGGASKWWSSDAPDQALLYTVEAVVDTWSAENAAKYIGMGFIHYHEMASVKDGSLHPTKVVWLKHTAVTGFTLDGGPAPQFAHSVKPGLDLEFVPQGMMPYGS